MTVRIAAAMSALGLIVPLPARGQMMHDEPRAPAIPPRFELGAGAGLMAVIRAQPAGRATFVWHRGGAR